MAAPLPEETGDKYGPFRDRIPDLDALGTDDEFDPERAYAHPWDFGRPEPGEKKRVCVVGGGIAGLTAAYELLEFGHEVVLLEASSRFGGRILTHYFADGTYGELGAMRIPVDHGCVRHYLDAFGLHTRPFRGKNQNGWCLFRHAPKMRRHEWDRDWSHFYSVPARVGGQSASLVVEDVGRAAGVMTARDLWESLSNRLTTPRIQRLDATTLGQHALGVAQRLRRTVTDETWEFAGRTAHHIWLERCALLHWLREADIVDSSSKVEIEGGMDRLTRAFVARIREQNPDTLKLGARVLALEASDSDVAVNWRQADADGVHWEPFHYVVCTVPAPCTVQIRFRPDLPAWKREALTNVSYMGAGKTIMRCSKRHWEIFDRICGGTSVTDRPNQQCWYPSDNLRLLDDDESDHLTAETVTDFTRDLLHVQVEPIDREVKSEDQSHQPGVFLAAYLWGTNASRFASLSREERDDLICRSVAELHDHNDRYLEDVVHISWDEQSSPGGGAFAFFAPGEQRRYQAALCAPVPSERPRIFFAGEHIGILHGWIQSAMQTSLAAVVDVLQAP